MEEYSELRRSVSTYIDKYPTPTREQNDSLLKQLADMSKIPIDSRPKTYYRIREKIVLSNGGFAMKYVMKYKTVLTDNVSIMDLFQEANLGLIEAVDTFDVDLKTSFTTYAFFHIRKRIIDFIKKNKIIRAPRDIARNLKHVNEVKAELYTELQREPSALEVVAALSTRRSIVLTEDMIDNIVILLDLNSAGFEESFISEFNEQVSCEDERDDIFKRMEMNILKDLEKTSARVQDIVKLRFGIGKDYLHTLEEIKFMLKINDIDLS